MKARKMQEKRFGGTGKQFNSEMDTGDIEKYCALGKEEQKTMEQLYHSKDLSARGYHRLLKVARTIADLDGVGYIRQEHLLEAACYRPATEYFG